MADKKLNHLSYACAKERKKCIKLAEFAASVNKKQENYSLGFKDQQKGGKKMKWMQRVEKTSGRKREKSLARERCQVWMKYALIDRGNNANRETEALISKNQHNKSQQCQLACHLKNSLTQPSSSLQFVRIIFIQFVFIFFL